MQNNIPSGLLYFQKILDGEIVACKKMKQASQMVLDRYNKGLLPNAKYHYDQCIADKHINFIQTFCCIPEGELMGQPLILTEQWRSCLSVLYGFVNSDNKRQYRKFLVVIGRKAAKTTVLSAMELDALLNDGEGSPQIYNAATNRGQAMLGFTAAHKMVMMSPKLSKHIKKRKSDLYCPINMGYIKPLSKNTGSLDGLSAHFCTIDELAAITDRDAVDLLVQSTASRTQPITAMISTQGFKRGFIFDSEYDYAKGILDGTIIDDEYLPFIYEMDDPSLWDNESLWLCANPNLNITKSVEYLRAQVNKAKQDESYRNTVFVKDFNLIASGEHSLFDPADINPIQEINAKEFDYSIAALDGSDTTDLTACCAFMRKPNDPNFYVKSMFWITQNALDEMERKGKDRDKAPYRLWIDQGYMRIGGQDIIEKHVCYDWLEELKEIDDLYMFKVGYDKYHIYDDSLRQLESLVGKNNAEVVRQGWVTFSPPMKELKKIISQFVFDNPCMLWNLYNADAKVDIKDNWSLVKAKNINKIDGAAVLIMVYVIYQKYKSEFLSLNGIEEDEENQKE